MFNQGTLDLFNDAFVSNTAIGGTGSLPNGNANYGGGSGGGLYNGNGVVGYVLTLTDDTFTYNTAERIGGNNGFGGGIASESGNVIANYLTFTDNSAGAAGFGGAIGTYDGYFDLTNSTGSEDIGISNAVTGNIGTGIYNNVNSTNWTGSTVTPSIEGSSVVKTPDRRATNGWPGSQRQDPGHPDGARQSNSSSTFRDPHRGRPWAAESRPRGWPKL